MISKKKYEEALEIVRKYEKQEANKERAFAEGTGKFCQNCFFWIPLTAWTGACGFTGNEKTADRTCKDWLHEDSPPPPGWMRDQTSLEELFRDRPEEYQQVLEWIRLRDWEEGGWVKVVSLNSLNKPS